MDVVAFVAAEVFMVVAASREVATVEGTGVVVAELTHLTRNQRLSSLLRCHPSKAAGCSLN